MAEAEVIKHTKKIYKQWNSGHSFWHKLKEFFIEIFIIVFAISVSLWFHNWSEHRHEQQAVKEFLTGLKSDLQADIKEMESDKASYLQQKAAFSYIHARKLGESLQKDSLARYYAPIFNTTALNPNNGRFEGFKSAGKIGGIEDRELQNDIMDLYQENIPSLLNSTRGYIERKSKLFDFLQQHHKRLTDSTTNAVEILSSEEAYNIAALLTVTEEITYRYDAAATKMKKIIDAIDKAYGK